MNRILFFDGVCGLCNRTVDFLLAADSGKALRFAPLQGLAAREKLGSALTTELAAVVYFEDGKTYTRSTAVLRAAAAMGGVWRLALVLLSIPSPIRDGVYDFVARNRYAWFGKRETCRLPSPEERERFLP